MQFIEQCTLFFTFLYLEMPSGILVEAVLYANKRKRQKGKEQNLEHLAGFLQIGFIARFTFFPSQTCLYKVTSKRST